MNVTVQIERLILDGIAVAPYQIAALHAVVEAELTRVLGDSTLAAQLSSGGAVATLRAAPIQLAADIAPDQLGTQIAQAVAGSLGQ